MSTDAAAGDQENTNLPADNPGSETGTTPGDQTQFIEPDELLVATPYAEQVVQQLFAWDIALKSNTPPDREDHPLLGLTRLRLVPGDDTTKRTIPDIYRGENGAFLDIGRLLHELRQSFGSRHENWYPVMGKNRTLNNVQIGGGSVIFGGDGPPLAVADPETLAARWASKPGRPGTGVRVGMVDTKMFASPSLAGRWSSSYSDIMLSPAPTHADGHAAFVAGLILTEAPGAEIEIRGVLNDQGRADSWTVAKAIAEIGQSVDILNLSFSCLTGDGRPPLALATAIAVVTPGTVVVAAAGNHGGHGPAIKATIDNTNIANIHNCVSFPAGLDQVIAVGAGLPNGTAAPYSPSDIWVDLMADGDAESVFLATGLDRDGRPYAGFASWRGTSFASARVAGAIAARAAAAGISAHAAWQQIRSEVPRPSGPGAGTRTPVKRLEASPWWE